ncbi:MAG: FIST N-terminal domain-containing protein [Sporichthyaceae bacterium]
MKAGVGHSTEPHSFQAAAAAARMATAGLSTCDAAIVVSTNRHDPAAVRDGLRSVLGPDARLLGGNAVGVVTADYLGYEGFEVAVAALAVEDGERVDLIAEKDLPGREHAAGAALAARFGALDVVDPCLLLMYDAIRERSTEGFVLNMATPLLAGMGQGLGQWPPMAGVGTFGDLEGGLGHQLVDDDVGRGVAAAAVFSGGPRLDTVIVHGCRPVGAYHAVTRAEGHVVLEIDGRPAVDAIAAFLGPEFSGSWEDFPLWVTLGVNHGEKFGPYREDDYQARLVQAVDKERGGLVMFEDDLQSGVDVQLMRRSIDFGYIAERVEVLLERLGDRTPVLALYLDCAGRIGAISGSDGEEAAEIQQALAGRVPLLGMYTMVEIAEIRGRPQALDWTGVLCLLSC